jgi:hypothetical protein
MPTTEELSIQIGDRPGTLGKACRALADRGVNILALQSFPTSKGLRLVRFVVDNPRLAKAALATEGLNYTEAEVALVQLPHRPGALAQAASRLGEADINIDYAYCGVEPHTNAPLVILGVAEAGLAMAVLDQAAAEAAKTESLRVVASAGRR